MALQKTNKEYNSFSKGIITEATALTFPENATINEENFLLNRDGSRQRRMGMDYETDYVEYDIDESDIGGVHSDAAVQIYKWTDAGDGTYDFWVFQLGKYLVFGDATANSISAGGKAFTVNMDSFDTHADYWKYPVSMVSGKSYLFVSGKYINPFYIQYRKDTDAIITTSITMKIRDVVGIEDSLDISETPASLTDEHKYNLKNQGWTNNDTNIDEITDTIGVYYTAKTKYPSNSMISWFGKDATTEAMDATKIGNIQWGSSPAPKGRFILNLFSRNRSSISNVPNITTETETYRPEALAFHSGRLWYSGIQSDPANYTSSVNKYFNVSTYIFYSQLLETVDKSGKCYQEADPTSEDGLSDLVATDGGMINIPEMGKCLKMLSLKNSLLVFADNGIWSISGAGVDEGFSATAFQVQKVSSVGAMGAGSIVNAEENIIYFSYGGIYIITYDFVGGGWKSQNITETTIHRAYIDVPSSTKSNAVGCYDPTNKRVQWLYSLNPTYDGVKWRWKFTHELVYDLVLGAFYKHSISTSVNGPWVSGYVPEATYSTTWEINDVVAGAYDVWSSTNTNDVIAGHSNVAGAGATTIKYLTFHGPYDGGVDPDYITMTFSGYFATDFLDWNVFNGGAGSGWNFDSWLVTGWELMGDTMRNKQVLYFVPHFRRTENGFDGSYNLTNPSSCFVRFMWNWVGYDSSDPYLDGSGTGKWTTPVQIYRFRRPYFASSTGDEFRYGENVITTKNKVRGVGKALSIKLYSEEGKDLHILGWGMAYTGSSHV